MYFQCGEYGDFYPRPPRGGRRHDEQNGRNDQRFLSTPSARRATDQAPGDLHRVHISIHALREEGDIDVGGAHYSLTISIHALREEGDRRSSKSNAQRKLFLSTPSARRATDIERVRGGVNIFLSTPSARRATQPPEFVLLVFIVFLSTPSARRATIEAAGVR